MGLCCSCCKEEPSSQNQEPDERTHLLVDPVSSSVNILRTNSDDYMNQYPNSLPKKTDEQSALNRILQETATNVIDVAALDVHNLEQHEYTERMRHYMQRIQSVGNNSGAHPNSNASGSSSARIQHRTPCLLMEIPSADKILVGEAISRVDWDLITTNATLAANALSKVQIEHKENLVVPFGVPD